MLQCTIAGGRTKGANRAIISYNRAIIRNVLLSYTNMAAMTQRENHLYQKDDCISHSIGFDNWQITQSFFLIIDRSRKHIPSVACRRFVMLRIKLFSRFWNPGCAGVDFPAKPESENCRKSFPRFLSYQELWST